MGALFSIFLVFKLVSMIPVCKLKTSIWNRIAIINFLKKTFCIKYNPNGSPGIAGSY